MMQLSKETMEEANIAVKNIIGSYQPNVVNAVAQALLQGSEIRALVEAAKDVADNWSDPTMEHYRALRRGLAPFTQGEKR